MHVIYDGTLQLQIITILIWKFWKPLLTSLYLCFLSYSCLLKSVCCRKYQVAFLFPMAEYTSSLLMHEQAVGFIKLSGTNSKLKRNERKRNWNTISPLMILKLLRVTGRLPRHPLIEVMAQDANLVSECPNYKPEKKHCPEGCLE